ncbi:hypothetical protein NLG97_g7217 [Lecanicillium saksenae]|uniref:Uncharacterized protein n=1 Tax=Lecanicillium saksenae TaxID=468837 RepID=A0ACC1QN03_9HYPO|nr:hypothetical protein NLG97_g7217 [Lecanicillium saksenae]
MGLVVFAVLVLCAYLVVSQVVGLMRNIAKARRSGFKYIVVPCVINIPIAHYIYNIGSIIIKRFSLPEKCFWYLEALDVHLVFRNRHLWRERLDDAFIVVSPGSITLHSSNAELNSWVTSQRDRFPKCTEIYGVLKVFGPNLVTTEGAEWRHHRKLISGSFNEANAALTFQEAVRQSGSMLRKWTGEGEQEEIGNATGGEVGSKGRLLVSTGDDVTKLTLHIINYIGFGLQMLWPGEELPVDTEPEVAKFLSLSPATGHQTSFVDATDGMSLHLYWILIFSVGLLERMPLEDAKRAARAARDYVKYCNELLDRRLAEAKQKRPDNETEAVGMDLLGHLARTGHDDGGVPDRALILGNAFILQLAGHETTATTMHHLLIFLACHPEVQRGVQRDVDAVVGDAEPSTWEYSKVVNALLGSHAGAAVFETLRVMPPVLASPKKAAADEVVSKDGQSYTIPKGQDGSGETDICEWRPSRWLRTTKQEMPGEMAVEMAGGMATGGRGEKAREFEDETYEKGVGPTSSERLFRPARGSYLAFSEGARSCIGRRVAQTEMMAALAVIFRRHSIELVVDEGDGDDERQAYERARGEALEQLKTARTVVTLKLADGQHVGLRIVKRGEERFASQPSTFVDGGRFECDGADWTVYEREKAPAPARNKHAPVNPDPSEHDFEDGYDGGGRAYREVSAVGANRVIVNGGEIDELVGEDGLASARCRHREKPSGQLSNAEETEWAAGNWQLATGNWQLATGNWQLATGNWWLAAGKKAKQKVDEVSRLHASRTDERSQQVVSEWPTTSGYSATGSGLASTRPWSS